MTPLSIEEETRATSDEVNLVSRVRLLRVVTDRRVKLDHERSMRKDGNCKITRWWQAFGEGVSQTDMNYACRWFHV
jgi:hypothetical protein